MPEKIVSGIASWRDEIELALIFWFIGATIGIGQHLLSPTSFSWRIIIGRALSTGGLAVVAGTFLVMQPNMSPLSQMGVAAAGIDKSEMCLSENRLRGPRSCRSNDASTEFAAR